MKIQKNKILKFELGFKILNKSRKLVSNFIKLNEFAESNLRSNLGVNLKFKTYFADRLRYPPSPALHRLAGESADA